MKPVLIIDDATNGLERYAKSTCECCFRFAVLIALANFSYFLGSQLTSSISFTARSVNWHYATTLLMAVSVVVGMCTKKQVRWVNTEPIVTGMADAELIGISLGMDEVRDTMGQPSQSISFHFAIAFACLRTLPVPASIWATLLDMFPEVVQGYRRELRHRLV